MPSSVYIETSVVSFLTARPSRDPVVAAHQQVTRQWWAQVLPQVDGFVSPAVIAEIGRGDGAAASARRKALDTLVRLELNDRINQLANTCAKALDLPERAFADAVRLAVAAYHAMDYLLTWNCRHIASGRVRRIAQSVNAKRSMPTPVICTPEALMEV